MLQRIIISILLLSSIFIYGQTVISGKVVSMKNMPLQGASVYINNSSIGTITDDLGKFSLTVPKGNYSLIVSFIGFHTIQYNLDTEKYTKPFLFKTDAKNNLLNEVVISNKREKVKNRAYHLKRFKKAFLGNTKFAMNCTIKNEDALDLYFNEKTNTLTIEAAEPIEIINKDLGYKILYDLNHFKLTGKKIEYTGLTRFLNLKGNKRKQKKWKKNRLIAYQGSKMHFLRSLFTEKINNEGFIIDLIEKRKNPQYPSDNEIAFSKKIFDMYKTNNSPIDYSKEIVVPKTKLDTAILINRRLQKPPFYKRIIARNIEEKNITKESRGRTYLTSDYTLKVTYTKEKEEKNYRGGHVRLDKQISEMELLKQPIEILSIGQLRDPLATVVEKYWAFEQFANTLPLNYKPTN